MKVYLSFFLTFFLLNISQNCQSNMNASIEELLKRKYPLKGEVVEGDLVYVPSTPVIRMDLNLIETSYPDLVFYKTKLQTAYFEYPEVEVLAVVSNKTNHLTILLSLGFEPPNNDFLNLFINGNSTKKNNKVELAQQIMDLFASMAINPKLEVVNTTLPDQLYFKLWQNNLSYRIFKFYFDDSNKIILLEVEKEKNG